MPLWKDDAQEVDRVLHWFFSDSWAVRKGPWKLIGEGENSLTLVNLEKDIEEKSNHLKEQPDLADELMKLHLQWVETCRP